MKSKYLLIIFAGFVLFNCEKEHQLNGDIRKNPPNIPESVNYDLNDDTIDDIMIVHRWYIWDGFNSSGDRISGEGISGLIETLNGSSIFEKWLECIFFLKQNDTIRLNLNEPFFWNNTNYPILVSIENSPENDYLWPNEWEIICNMNLDSHYLGIKIENNNVQLIGWIQLTIDKATGAIQLLDRKFTTEEFIVVGI